MIIAPPTSNGEPRPPPAGSPAHLQQGASQEEENCSASPLASSSVESNTTAEVTFLTGLRYVLLAAEMDRRSHHFTVLCAVPQRRFLCATPFLELEAATRPVAQWTFFPVVTAVATGKLQTSEWRCLPLSVVEMRVQPKNLLGGGWKSHQASLGKGCVLCSTVSPE